MDIWDVVKVMWRRWYVTAPMVLVTLVATLSAGTVIKSQYETTASVMLVPSAVESGEDRPEAEVNPWVQVGLDGMAEAVSIAVQNKASRDRVAKEGLEAEYVVGVLSRTSIVQIEVAAGSPRQARATAARVIKLIESEVTKRQQPFKRGGSQIGVQVLDPGDNVVESRTPLRRGQVVLFGAGLLLTAALVIALDALLRRRRGGGGQVGRRGDGPPPGPGRRHDPADDSTITLPAVNLTESYESRTYGSAHRMR